MINSLVRLAPAAVLLLGVFGCAPRPGALLERRGDEIVACGQLFHIGTPVVLWLDPYGYDAYRVEPRFADEAAASQPAASQPGTQPARRRPPPPEGARYGSWRKHVPPEVAAEIRSDGWRLERLREHVDLFVLHYDVCGTSRQCFKVLHDLRGLSVHFMLDLDGTIYQTLDLKERAWHAGSGNDRSIGIEIANIGAYPDLKTLEKWYGRDERRRPVVTLPAWMGDGGLRTPQFLARPARPEPIVGEIHGKRYMQYDFTPEQYVALGKLTAALCRILPRIRPEFPREADGRVATRVLTDAELAQFSGILGHYHLTTDKIDPGPAFDWERLARDLRRYR